MEEENMVVTEDLDFDPTSIQHNQIGMIQLEHHIVYSPSYQVPVLYSKACYGGNKKTFFFSAMLHLKLIIFVQ
jgi:hypothetical protein